MRDSARFYSDDEKRDPFPPLLIEGPTIILAALILIALLAIAVMAVGYEIGRLRGEQTSPSVITSPAPAGQVGSVPPADAVPSSGISGIQT